MAKQLLFSEEARRAVQRGVDAVANAVKVTRTSFGLSSVRGSWSVPSRNAGDQSSWVGL